MDADLHLMSSPFLGPSEDGHGHLGFRVNNLVDLSRCFLIDLVLILSVPKATCQVVHCREVIVALPLGAQAYLVTMVLDL